MEWTFLGKLLIAIGSGIMVLGIVLLAADRVPWVAGLLGWLGKLPGDLSFKRDNISIYFPIATSLLLSILLSLLLYLLGWLFRR